MVLAETLEPNGTNISEDGAAGILQRQPGRRSLELSLFSRFLVDAW